jgi:hypothetical protein
MRPPVWCIWCVTVLSACATGEESVAEETAAGNRPVMRQLPASAAREMPPSARQLVDARAECRRRFREPLSHTETTAGASQAAGLMIEAAMSEEDRGLKWVLLEEARRLGVQAGNAPLVARATMLASAAYEFDAIDVELRALLEIPLRGLSPPRAAAFAEAAEQLATRAEVDGRRDVAIDAQRLAIRGWQQAGNDAAAIHATMRHDQIDRDRVTQPSGRRAGPP